MRYFFPAGDIYIVVKRKLNKNKQVKTLVTIYAGEAVEKGKPSCIAGGNVNSYNHFGAFSDN